MDNSHRLIKRFEKEERLFPLLKEQIINELKINKGKRVEEVIQEINQRIEFRKEKAKKDYLEHIKYEIGSGWSFKTGRVLGGILGLGVWLLWIWWVGESGRIHENTFQCFIIFPISIIVGIIIGGSIQRAIAISIAMSKVKIEPGEESEREQRIKGVEIDIKQKIDKLDDEIRNDIFTVTDNEIDNKLEEFSS